MCLIMQKKNYFLKFSNQQKESHTARVFDSLKTFNTIQFVFNLNFFLTNEMSVLFFCILCHECLYTRIEMVLIPARKTGCPWP